MTADTKWLNRLANSRMCKTLPQLDSITQLVAWAISDQSLLEQMGLSPQIPNSPPSPHPQGLCSHTKLSFLLELLQRRSFHWHQSSSFPLWSKAVLGFSWSYSNNPCSLSYIYNNALLTGSSTSVIYSLPVFFIKSICYRWVFHTVKPHYGYIWRWDR